MQRAFSLFCLCLALPFAALAADHAAESRPLAQDEFVASLAQQIQSHFTLEGELALELLRVWNAPARTAANWEIQVTDFPTLPASSMLVRCRVLADGQPAGDYTVTLRAALWRDTWSARQPTTLGAKFDPSQLEVRRTDLFRDREALPASVGDDSYIFARSVSAGRLLTWRDIARRPLVRKGDVVEVSATDGNLTLTLKAVALQNGAQGEVIPVRNPESRKDFSAFVIDENRLQVRF